MAGFHFNPFLVNEPLLTSIPLLLEQDSVLPTPYADLSVGVRNGRHRLLLLLLVVIVGLRQDMEHSAVTINTGSGLAAVNITDDHLRRGNSFEDRIRYIYRAMT